MKLQKSNKDPELYYYFNAKDEKLWMFRHKFYDKSGQRKEKKKSGFKTERAALKALLDVKAATLRGESKQVEYDHLTVGEWLDTWYEMNHKKWKDSTRIQRELIIRLHLKPLLGHYKLQKIDRIVYQRKFLDVIEGKYKPYTVRSWHNVFKIAINAAVEEEILSRNRFTKITISDNDNEKINYFTSDQLAIFLEDVKKHENIMYYSFFMVVSYTGMRRGEALGLQWKNINFNNHTITIERTRDDKGIRSPKTKNSSRTILVDELLINQLASYKTWCKKILLSYGKKLTNDTPIFISEHSGDPIGIGSTLYVFKNILKRTKLPEITIHGLRHTHATILLNRGLNVKVIAERLGNTPDMIYKVYGHVLRELERESVALFSQSLEASGAKIGANL